MRWTAKAFVAAYAQWIFRLRFVILVVWVGLAAASAAFIMKFVSNTSQEFSPPSGTQAEQAQDVFALDFPALHALSYFNVYIQLTDAASTHSSIVDVPSVEIFTNVVSLAFVTQLGPVVASVSNYYTLRNRSMTEAADHLVAPDRRSMALPVAIKADFVSKQAAQYGDVMKSIVADHVELLGTDATAFCNGIPIFVEGIVKNAQDELGMMDAVAIPLAMLIMSITVKSLRLMILPLITIGFTLAISFGAMYFVTLQIAVSSTTPSLMMSLCIAMSIDYNLFILSRYKEELLRGSANLECITNVLETAGHTILVSGVTLLVCLLSLIFFPLNMLQSFGFGCGLAILVALLVCLTFAPALLLTFDTFFERCAAKTQFPEWFPKRVATFLNSGGYNTMRDYLSSQDLSNSVYASKYAALSSPRTPRHFSSRDVSGSDKSPAGETLQDHESRRLIAAAKQVTSRSDVQVTSVEAQYFHRTQSIFYRLEGTLKFPRNLIIFVCVLAISLGLGYPITDFKTTDTFLSYLPRGAAVTDNFVSFVNSFGYGYTQPYHIMLSRRSPTQGRDPTRLDATSEAFFLYFQGFLKRMVSDTSVATVLPSQFLGPLTLFSNWTTYEQFAACLPSLSPTSAPSPPHALDDVTNIAIHECNPNIGGMVAEGPMSMLSYPAGTTTSSGPQAMYVMLTTSFDPMGNLGDPYYKGLMALAASYQAEVVQNPSIILQNITAACNVSDIIAVADEFRLYFSGVGPSSMDAIDTVYRLFPIIIGVSVGAVLVVVGFAFRSIVMPLRSVISIACTQLFVFGLVVLTYGSSPGILSWTGWGSVTSSGAVSWTAPVVAFPVIVGVALDYDIFLITRIVELIQEEGLSTTDAVLHALCSTGRIITSAGIIMAVAFFGLLLSKTQILNLLGFFMVTAVLFDTFIVRTLLVPTLMSMLGKWNWFPRKLVVADSDG